MKKNYFKFSSLALIAGMCVIASCDNDDDPIVNPDDSSTLHGAVTSDLTLESGKTYTLDGELIVKAGATLNIEEGVTVVSLYDDKVDYILVEQGARINAVGTASSPIVMTSQKEEPGAWGGIHICGFARTNAEGGKGKPLAVESAETENALLEKVSRLSGVAISGTLDSKEGIYTDDKFVADGNTSNAALGYASLEDIAKECSWMNGWTR